MRIQYRGVIFMQSTMSLTILTIAILASHVHGQNRELPIWPGKAPGSETWTQKEIDSPQSSSHEWERVHNVVTPTITVFQPEHVKANGTGIIVCPGGGFEFLDWESEGTVVARWLAARGITAFVLKYRVMKTPEDSKDPSNYNDDKQAAFHLAVRDGVQAVKYVRQHAAELGISADRIGIMGFSAGGDVAMGAALDYDGSSRPNFAAMMYGGFSRRTAP